MSAVDETKISAGVIYSSIKYDPPNANESPASKLLEALKKHSDRCLLVDARTKRKWTGAQLLDETSRIATNLVRLANFEAGEVVLSMCDHTGDEVVFVLGAMLAGAAICGMSVADGYNENKTTMDLMRPNLVVLNFKNRDRLEALEEECEHLRGLRVVYIERDIELDNSGVEANQRNKFTLGNLTNGPLDLKLVEDTIYKKIDVYNHAVTYMLTSGSTGHSKVVPSTHRAMVCGLASLLSATRYPLNSAQGMAKPGDGPLLPLDENSVFSGDLPLDNGAGLCAMYLSFLLGAKIIILPAYEVEPFWQGVHDYRINASIASTTFAYDLFSYLKRLVARGEASRRWDLSCFKYLACCGSKLAFVDLIHEIRSTYPTLNFTQMYGCTEVGFISALPVAESYTHIESAGRFFAGIKAKIVDHNTGQLITTSNTRGELCLWTESKFKQYRCHPDDDAAQIFANCHDKDGFYKTGDLVHMDGNGLLYIHGRIKDTLYLAEDWKITPAELEQVINEHPLVEESAVVGVPSTSIPGCDAPKAFVKLVETVDDSSLLSDELLARLRAKDLEFVASHIYKFVADRTAEPKHLTGGVRILKEFPRVGMLKKIDRKVLKNLD